YREIRAELIVDEAIPLDAPEELALQTAVVELVARLPTEVGERVAQVTSRVHGGALADVVASTVMEDVIRRFEILSELDVRERMRAVTEETLLMVGGLETRDPGRFVN